jgi:hypothetical protein
MREFMLLVRNEIDHQESWSSEQHQRFLKACETYIGKLQKAGKLKAAQPLAREGTIISGTPGAWQAGPITGTRDVIVGYYHVFAEDLNDAIVIAKGNPEFAFGTTARVEVRPVKTKEATSDYVYPAGETQPLV